MTDEITSKGRHQASTGQARSRSVEAILLADREALELDKL